MPDVRPSDKEGTTVNFDGSDRVGSFQYWQFDQERSSEKIGTNEKQEKITTRRWEFIRSQTNPGVAEIAPGNSVTAKLAFSSNASTISLAKDLTLFWSQEYVGSGNGNLKDRVAKQKSESHAVSNLLTSGFALAAGLTAALAY